MKRAVWLAALACAMGSTGCSSPDSGVEDPPVQRRSAQHYRMYIITDHALGAVFTLRLTEPWAPPKGTPVGRHAAPVVIESQDPTTPASILVEVIPLSEDAALPRVKTTISGLREDAPDATERVTLGRLQGAWLLWSAKPKRGAKACLEAVVKEKEWGVRFTATSPSLSSKELQAELESVLRTFMVGMPLGGAA